MSGNRTDEKNARSLAGKAQINYTRRVVSIVPLRLRSAKLVWPTHTTPHRAVQMDDTCVTPKMAAHTALPPQMMGRGELALAVDGLIVRVGMRAVD